VASADENGESYYTIAYTPAAKKFDSQFHKIQVRLDASGDKLSYRRGYYADSQDKSPCAAPEAKTWLPRPPCKALRRRHRFSS